VLGPDLATTPASDLVDIAGNALEDSNVLQIYYDVTDPTVQITSLKTAKSKQPIILTFQLAVVRL
jgi:hypothetical protein